MTQDWLPFGFLPVLKPEGPTSHDIVARVRRLLPRNIKVGHTGTLDPFASGVLILAIGKATRFTDEVHRLRKRYRAEILLGTRTDTLDPTGETVEEREAPPFDQARLDALAARFIGKQQQTPPIFSAKRVQGRKSYQLARRNRPVALKPVEIEIDALELEKLDERLLACVAQCSTGAYMRALGRDIAEALGTCGCLKSLVRTAIGPVELDHCAQLEDLTRDNLGRWLTPVPELLPQFPEMAVSGGAFTAFMHGRAYPVDEPYPPSFLGVYKDITGRILGVFRCAYEPEIKSLRARMACYIAEQP